MHCSIHCIVQCRFFLTECGIALTRQICHWRITMRIFWWFPTPDLTFLNSESLFREITHVAPSWCDELAKGYKSIFAIFYVSLRNIFRWWVVSATCQTTYVLVSASQFSVSWCQRDSEARIQMIFLLALSISETCDGFSKHLTGVLAICCDNRAAL